VLAKQGGSGDVKVFVDRKVSFTTNPSSHKPARDNKQNDNLENDNLQDDNRQNFQLPGTPQPQALTIEDVMNAGDTSPITPEVSNSWPIFRFLLTLLVIAVLMYFFLHYRS